MTRNCISSSRANLASKARSRSSNFVMRSPLWSAAEIGWPLLPVQRRWTAARLNRYLQCGGGASQLDEVLRRAGNSRVTEIQVDTDHSFSDHRMALAAAVTDWLQS